MTDTIIPGAVETSVGYCRTWQTDRVIVRAFPRENETTIDKKDIGLNPLTAGTLAHLINEAVDWLYEQEVAR